METPPLFSVNQISNHSYTFFDFETTGLSYQKDKVIEISNSFPFLRYVGWDVAITEDGFKIIEANSLTSLGVLQRKGGYLDDHRLRKVFKIK